MTEIEQERNKPLPWLGLILLWIVTITIALNVGLYFGGRISTERMQRECVLRGAARWQVDTDGKVSFLWNFQRFEDRSKISMEGK